MPNNNRLPRGGSSAFSNLGSLHRALSPSAQAAASAGTRSGFTSALLAATTVEEVIIVVPVRYRDAVAPALRSLADSVERAHSTLKQKRALSESLTSGSFPKWVEGAIGTPALQPMAAFAESAEGRAALAEFKDLTSENLQKYREDWANAAISLLDAQHTHYSMKCADAAAVAAFTTVVQATTQEHVRAFPHMSSRAVLNENGTPSLDAAGQPITEMFPDYDATQTLYRQTEQDVISLASPIVNAIRAVVTNRFARADAKDKKKASLRQQAEDVVMAAPADDAAPVASGSGTGFNTAQLRQVIREEIVGARAVRPSVSSMKSLLNGWITEIEGGPSEWGPRPAAQEGQEEAFGEEEEIPTPTSCASRARWWVWQRERAWSCMTAPGFNYFVPASFPDEILVLVVPLALKIIAWRAPLAVQEALRFRHAIHVQKGLLLPTDLLKDLGVGMRYIMPITVKNTLPLDAWTDFERRFRWFYHLTVKPIDNKGSIDYTPEFDTRKASTKAPPRAPDAIESGLEKGRALVTSWSPAEPSTSDRWARRLAPDFRGRIHEWCDQNEAIITQTDKNLGLAAVKKSWYIDQTRSLLLNERDYQPLSMVVALTRMEYCVVEYRERLMSWESETSLPYNTQLCNFLWEGVEPFLTNRRELRSIQPVAEHFEEMCHDAGVRPALLPLSNLGEGLELYRKATPQFYGLPKIHKKPWKMRPIFPCHSAVIAHPARVLSKLLKMILAVRPFVLEGTKAFCVDLQKVAIDPFVAADQQYWLITGDIVAYYPNVPVQDAAEIIREMWLWFCSEHDVPLVYTELFNGLLALNTELPSVCQFMEEYFEQKRGLAMGMHCAPDLANLYAAHFEEDFVPRHQNILFYRRFIDDLFFLVQANSAESATALVSQFSIPGCDITWSAPMQSAVFLDVFVWISPFGSMQWKPYSKPHNHKERIPWISAHTTTVKRGTFYGELSRLAILSSTEHIFRGEVRGLATLYRNRGYPDKVIKSWLKETHSRWINRHTPRPRRDAVLVLKSDMNPVWNAFPLQELTEIVHDAWKDFLPSSVGVKRRGEILARPDSIRPRLAHSSGSAARRNPAEGGNHDTVENDDWDSATRVKSLLSRPLLLSKKRVHNINDLFNTWKKQLVYAAIIDAQQTALYPEVDLPEEEGDN
jgi:hypothetical protein